MEIHITLNGDIIDLLAFDDEQFGFYHQCLNAYRQNVSIDEFLKLMQDPSNPMMKGKTMITKEIFNSSLYKAVQDLEFRLRIKQGLMKPANPEYAEIEPAQQDEFLSANAAGKEAGVSATAIIKAVQEGRIAGHQEKNGRWKISRKSLEQYSPDPVRQAAKMGK